MRRYAGPETFPTAGGNTVDDDGNDEGVERWHSMPPTVTDGPFDDEKGSPGTTGYIGGRTCPTTGGNSVDDVGDDEGKRRKAWEADGRESPER